MPIVTHEDEKLLAKIDVELAKEFSNLGSYINKISRAEKKMGDLYQKYTKALKKYARKMRDKSKQLDILTRANRAGYEKKDADEFKQQIQQVEDRIKGLESYSDRLKDMALQKEFLVKRMEEYTKLIKGHSKIREDIIDINRKIDKEKSKMVAAKSLTKLEDKLKDLQRKFDRSEKEIDKKWERIEEERVEVNKMWQALKDCINNFS